MKAYTQIAAQMTDAIVSGGSFVRPSNLEPSTWVFESLRENVYKFSGAKSLAMYQDFRKALTTTRSFEEFRNKVIGLDREYNERWLRTEYNTARSMAQHAKKWESLSRYEFLEYRTVGDDKVRLAHEKLDGITLRTDDPLWDIIYPPNDWNCRCTVIPGRKDKVDQNRQAAEAASINPDVIKDYFRRNVGKEQVVFKDDHPYFQATGTSELGSFSALENYGMRSVARLVKDANRPAHIRLADVQSARDLWAKTAKVQTRDQMTWINDVAFDLAVQDERWKYANEVPNILAKADEVWSERRNGLVYKRYIRYYQGKALVLEYEVNKPNDWTIIEFSQNILNDTERSRRGALIYTR
jgi:SPP1 gp7 family putative phage head morphogenesis protein